jgi:hypothetical protein
MDTEIHQTPAAGKLSLVELRLIGAVGVVKRHIDGKDVTDVSRLDQSPDRFHGVRSPVGQVDAEQAIVASGHLHHRRDLFRRSAEGLLAEDSHATIERSD